MGKDSSRRGSRKQESKIHGYIESKPLMQHTSGKSHTGSMELAIYRHLSIHDLGHRLNEFEKVSAIFGPVNIQVDESGLMLANI